MIKKIKNNQLNEHILNHMGLQELGFEEASKTFGGWSKWYNVSLLVLMFFGSLPLFKYYYTKKNNSEQGLLPMDKHLGLDQISINSSNEAPIYNPRPVIPKEEPLNPEHTTVIKTSLGLASHKFFSNAKYKYAGYLSEKANGGTSVFLYKNQYEPFDLKQIPTSEVSNWIEANNLSRKANNTYVDLELHPEDADYITTDNKVMVPDRYFKNTLFVFSKFEVMSPDESYYVYTNSETKNKIYVSPQEMQKWLTKATQLGYPPPVPPSLS